MTNEKKYTGTVYIGVVGPENDIAECRDSIEQIARQPGDVGPHYIRATKGYEARQLHLNNWFNNTHHEFMLLLDHDQVFPPDTLHRLRSHGLPFVSGYYLRRRYAPLAPVWFKFPEHNDDFPRDLWLEPPGRGVLHPLGGSGWGCMLIHREVVAATKPLLKGEPEIIEDDMDVWPYDLGAIMGAIGGLRELVTTRPRPAVLYPALESFARTLETEIRPLRCLKSVIGSDIRYPFYAREAGYILYGDPDVRVSHMLNYPLAPDDYENYPEEERKATEAQSRADTQAERTVIQGMLEKMRAV